MKRLLLLLLALPVALASASASLPRGGDDLPALLDRFKAAAASKDSDERVSALEALIALNHQDSVPALREEFGRAAIDVRTAHDDLYRHRYQLERVKDLVATLELRAKRDTSLSSSIDAQRKKISDLERKAADAEKKLQRQEPWRDALGAGIARLFDSFDSGKRRKAEKTLWELTEEGGPSDRVASVELLGLVGAPGTAVELQGLVEKLLATRSKAVRELRKQEADVRKFERRLQDEARENGGRTFQATNEQYERAKAESSKLVASTTLDAFLIDAAVQAGGRALAREEGKELEKSLSSLLRAMKKSKDGVGLKLVRMLGEARTDAVRASLRAFLVAEDEPLGRASAIRALAESKDTSIVPELGTTFLAAESWLVRSAAASALADLRDKRGVPAMIERLEVEENGRVRTDLMNALQRLTGQRIRSDALLWKRWWKEAEETFEVPAEKPEAGAEASDEVEDTVGVTFFGIRTESQRVIFVFDLSGSMNWSMVPRNNPDDDANRDPDLPRDGESSRLDAAKVDLQKAMGGLRDGAKFNVVFYATDVWPWRDQLVEMSTDTRTEALEMIGALEATGGTNIYGALKSAFELAGVEAGGEWSDPKVDTIFLLTDGRPSVGVTTDPDEILAFVRELNASAGITIHTIGLSGAQDAYLLRSLAEQSGGSYAAR